MIWLMRAIKVTMLVLVLIVGVWMVVVNDQPLSLNLVLLSLPPLNAGFLVLAAFSVGGLVGLLVGLQLVSILKLRVRIQLMQRDLQRQQRELEQKRLQALRS